MLAKVLSSAVIGIDAYVVEVEVDITSGLPAFTTVGLPEAAVKESKERVKAAISNSGYNFPDDRITVNLAPAHIKKEGTGFDLPMAIGILCASGIVDQGRIAGMLFQGELSLDGRVKPVFGSLPMALAAKQTGHHTVLVPEKNGSEAAVVDGLTVYPIRNLSQAVAFIQGHEEITPLAVDVKQLFETSPGSTEDLSEVKGQEHVKRAMEIVAAGGHNLLMVGAPGAGKTMLARRLAGILPPLTLAEAIDTTKIYSVLGMLGSGQALVTQRCFRSPHHTISDAGLIGGGMAPRPGEVSLAHHGVLFLDELPEFKKNVLEVLRQPLEDGRVTIARARSSITYPASIMLVAAMNPCPCGYFGDAQHECRCTAQQIQRYRSKISGPLLDRIDLQVEVPHLSYEELVGDSDAESSSVIRQRVVQARTRQSNRFLNSGVFSNAQMTSRQIKQQCKLTSEGSRLLEKAVDRWRLSARSFQRILKVSRTIADLAQKDQIGTQHISEAIQYRVLDRSCFENNSQFSMAETL